MRPTEIKKLRSVVELEPRETSALNDDFFARLRALHEPDLEQIKSAYLDTLVEWHVMCPHPVYDRTFHTNCKWFTCNVCKCPVIG